MRQYPIELVLGPKDGERWILKEDLPIMRFAAMPPEPNWVEAREEATPEDARIEYLYLEYERSPYTRNGYRLYRYAPPKEKT